MVSRKETGRILKFIIVLSIFFWLPGMLFYAAAVPEDFEVIGLENRENQKILLQLYPLDPILNDGQKTYFLIEKKYINELRDSGLNFTVETARFAPFLIRQTLSGLKTQGGLNGAYHSYQETAQELKKLASTYPSLSRLLIIGKSLEQRNIYALKISRNPGSDEEKPGVVFLGCHHAREWISVEVPLLLGKYLLENYSSDSRVKSLVDSAMIWIIPLVNPDGLEYSILNYRLWRKNRRYNPDGSYGVDLNRNYSYAWGYDDYGSSPTPSSAVFRGAAPFSEPETEAIRNFFSSRRLSAALSYHSYSQMILYPWGYTDQPAEDEPLLAALASEMAGLIYQVNGRLYQTGRASSLLYVTNGDFTDWAYGTFRIPAFTVELPPVDLLEGGFLNSEDDINSIFLENLPAALYLIEWAINNHQNSSISKEGKEKIRLEKKIKNVVKDKMGAIPPGREF